MEKQEKMFALVDQWRKSGLTRKVFAQQHGVTHSSLKYWCRKRDDKVMQRTIAPHDFTEILSQQEQYSKNEVSEKINNAMVELELPSGIKIRIY